MYRHRYPAFENASFFPAEQKRLDPQTGGLEEETADDLNSRCMPERRTWKEVNHKKGNRDSEESFGAEFSWLSSLFAIHALWILKIGTPES